MLVGSGCAARIEEALAPRLPGLTRQGPGRWTFAAPGPAVQDAEAALHRDFFVLEAGLCGRRQVDHAESLLLRNAGLPAPAKIVLPPGCLPPCLRAEVLASEALDESIADVTASFLTAAEQLRQDVKPRGECDPSPRAGPEDEAVLGPLGARCEEAGWPVRERPGGRLAVHLGDEGDGRWAGLEAGPGGAPTLAVELPGAERPSGTVRKAAALLLLAAGGQVRLVRPAVAPAAAGWTPRLEVPFARVPGSPALHAALEALAVACRLYAAEVEALGDERIASHYLELRCRRE